MARCGLLSRAVELQRAATLADEPRAPLGCGRVRFGELADFRAAKGRK